MTLSKTKNWLVIYIMLLVGVTIEFSSGAVYYRCTAQTGAIKLGTFYTANGTQDIVLPSPTGASSPVGWQFFQGKSCMELWKKDANVAHPNSRLLGFDFIGPFSGGHAHATPHYDTNLDCYSSSNTIRGSFTASSPLVEIGFYVRVKDSNGDIYYQKYLYRVIQGGPLFITANKSLTVKKCESVSGNSSAQFTAASAVGTKKWSMLPTPLAGGLTINSTTGIVSGVITSPPGTYNATVTVKDNNGAVPFQVANATLTVTVLPPDPLTWVTLPNLPVGTFGATYSATVKIAGGRAPYKYTLKNGSTLPGNLTVNATTGIISGKLIACGNFSFTITGNDSCTGISIDQTFNLNIKCPAFPVTITTAEILSCFDVNQPVSAFYLSATGGTPPYTWSIVAGKLPGNLTLSGNGCISGNITQSGNFSVTIQAKGSGSNGGIGQKTYSGFIYNKLEITTASPLTTGTNGTAYTANFTATGGKPPYTWQILPQIYVAGYSSNKILKFTENGILQTYAGTGVASSTNGTLTTATFCNPYGMAFDSYGNIYVADNGSSKIRKILASGNVTTLAPTENFASPEDMVADDLGNVFVSCTTTNNIRKIATDGSVTTLTSNGSGISVPQGMCWDLDGDMILANPGLPNLLKISPLGDVSTVAIVNGAISGPHDVKVHSDGYIYVVDSPSRIAKVSPTGVVTTLSPVSSPLCLSVDRNGYVYVSTGYGYIYKISPAGVPSPPIASNLGTIRGVEINPYEDLPLGLTLNATTGLITGTPERHGLYNITYQVTDACGNKVSKNGTLTIDEVDSDMVTVLSGTLPESSGLGNQTVATFQIARYETTWGKWKAVRDWAVSNNKGYDLAGVGGTYPDGSADNFPVVNVSWYDVVKWCNAKSEKEGRTPVYTVNGTTYKTGEFVPTVNETANGYRLPSEKEWEWAARGGVSGVSPNYVYSGSNSASEVAWTIENSSGGSHVVGAKLPNELGIYDMSGNVWEWCEDVAKTSEHKIRGASWFNNAGIAALAERSLNDGYNGRGVNVGLRLARSSGN